MVLKLYGTIISTNTQRVLVVARQLGVPIELLEVDYLREEHKQETYLEEKHPFGRVPTAVDEDGFRIIG